MSVILGFNAFHADSAACVVVDGELKAAVAEERLGDRVKHSSAFPSRAIRWVLAEAGVSLTDVSHVAIARDPSANKSAKVKYVLGHPQKGFAAALEFFRRNRKTSDTMGSLPEICDVDPAKVTFETVHVEHHLAHIASSYYTSPFDGLTAGFSYDASGDFASAMAARCEGTRIDVLDRVHLPDSLGFFYTAICQLIGFDQFGEEYKVMGLASYGDDKHAELMRELVTLPDDGWFRLTPGYFGMHRGGESGGTDANQRLVMGRLYTDRLKQRVGTTRGRREPITQREMDLARSCQARFEEAAIHCMHRLHGQVSTDRLVTAGGCALNGVANARILRDTPFSRTFMHAAASDDGTCVGAAMWCWHNVLGETQRYHMQHAYWGPAYSDEALREAAESCDMPVEALDEQTVLSRVAQLIHDGHVVGWHQGRSEWGPRALGNRSILANPTLATMKDTINAKIKRREGFRPFAPTVLREDVSTYFEQDVFSPFMMHVVKIRPEWRDRLPAVTHVDGTGRLQSIERANNAKYYDLIRAFRALSGVGIVLNTSFNENEPIVDTPRQAVDCFLRTGLDALCLGNYLVVKPEGRRTAGMPGD